MDFVKAEGGDVRHAIAEVLTDGEVRTMCGRQLSGRPVDETDDDAGELCDNCLARLA